jgi:hypothetical protein
MIPVGILTAAGGSSLDPATVAFDARVIAAGGTLTNNEKTAVNSLVLSLKSAGIWNLMRAIYPMVGASAASCAQNLVSSFFTGTFTSGWTFASTGVTPNGTSAYMNTGLNPVAQGLTSGNSHLAYYARTAATTADPAEIGNFNDSSAAFVLQSKSSGGLNRYFYNVNIPARRTVATAPIGFMNGSAIANTRRDLYFNGVSVANNTSTDNAGLGNYNLYIGAANIAGSQAASFTNSQCAIASIGNGLSSTQASDFYTAIQTFQTTLSRQV